MLRLPPQNIAHATSCSHSNAICNHSFKKRIELRRQKHTQSSFKAQLHCGKKKTTNRPQPQPPHRRGTFHRRLQPLYTEKHKVSCSGFLSTTLPMQHSCSHSNAICNHSFKKRIELRRQKHTQSSFKAQLHCGKKKNDKPTAAATAAPTRYLSSSPAATLHGKTQGFVLWLPLHNIAHATFMQPFQCDLQPQLQETHRTTQTETHPKQLQGTVTLRQEKNDKPTAAATAAQTRYLSSSPAATLHGKTQGFVLWLPLHNIAHATFMQPFQCDLQPQLQETQRTTQTETHPKQLQGTVTLRQEKNDKPTAAATAAQTRYLSSSPAATLHGKTQGFVLWLPLHNIAHATFMQPFQCDLQPQLQETYRTTQTETHPKQLQGTVTWRWICTR